MRREQVDASRVAARCAWLAEEIRSVGGNALTQQASQVVTAVGDTVVVVIGAPGPRAGAGVGGTQGGASILLDGW
ncbi:hypothetical protein AB0O74_31285 [Streptomyces rubiginosohelvolus]|uniref:hypothetical protein n=1 Tax=Streptomyces rubiginosohelvolus TaxID=67362 RepID=UPI003423CF43